MTLCRDRWYRWTTHLLALLGALSLAACGGGGGSSGGGGGQPSPGLPVGAWVTPTTAGTALAGETLAASFTADDDTTTEVRIYADVDGDLNTAGDRTLLFGPVNDQNGAVQSANLDLGTLPASGAYTLALVLEDGENPPQIVLLPGQLVVLPVLAAPRGGGSSRPAYGVSGDTIVFSVGETEQGPPADRNGDSDPADGVISLVDTLTGAVTNTMIASDTAPGANPARPIVLRSFGGTIAWRVPEAFQGAINADGDLQDTMLAYVNPGAAPTATLNVLGGISSIVAGNPSRIVASILESDTLTDHNGDGDTNDLVLGTLDTGWGGANDLTQWVLWQNTHVPAGGFGVAGQTNPIAYHVNEAAFGVGGADLNGDTDTTDTFIFVTNTLQPAPGPSAAGAYAGNSVPPGAPPISVDPAAAFALSGAGTRVAYYINEAAIGAGGTDFNADGDAVDFVPAYWDSTTGVQGIAALGIGAGNSFSAAPGSNLMVIDGNRIFFTVQEQGRAGVAPGSNNDGDGGADLALLAFLDTTTLPAFGATALDFTGLTGVALQGLSLDGGGTAVQHAPGTLAVNVNEAANGNVDLNGNGIVDNAFLLIETQATPPRVVRPAGPVYAGLVSFDTVPTGGNIPATGLGDPLGLVLHCKEQGANGDLNNDSDTSDALLVHISLVAPYTVHILDAGGDRAALGGGRLAFTARESYTTLDLDGLPGVTGHAFRVYDRATGAVVNGASPCAASSIPATENGSLFAYLRDESAEGRDLNGDGDQTDLVLGTYRP